MEINSRKVTRYIWPDEAKRLIAKALRVQDRKPPAALRAVRRFNRLLEFTISRTARSMLWKLVIDGSPRRRGIKRQC